MEELVFRRIFHPVGQGAFFTEQLLDSADGVIANVVYDCGSHSPGFSTKIKHEIDTMFEGKNKIDALFLSHFDDDHINYVDYLCSQHYMDGAKMFVPLLVEEKYLEVTFVKDNYAKLYELANGYGFQIVRVKFDNIDSNPNADPVFFDDVNETIESGTKLKHKKCPLWNWVPFNIKNEDLISHPLKSGNYRNI